jgi:hypothetical protein
MEGAQKEIVVSTLAEDFFVKFTGFGTNTSLTTTQSPGSEFKEGEEFTNTQTSVTISRDANGVGGDTIGKDEVLNLQFFSTEPNANPNSGTPTAIDGIFIKFDGIGNSEDLVVLLKLIDPVTNKTETRAIIVQNSDFYRRGDTLPEGFTGISLDQNDAVVFIDKFDFNGPGENFLIAGAQILSSVSGVSGSGIDLNKVPGAAGASSQTRVAFTAADTDQDVLKVSDIGFLRSNDQTVRLTFNVTVTDSDGDSVSTQLKINPITPPVVLDLDGDGLEFLAKASGVAFDYDGDGVAEQTAWVGADDGILVFDVNGDREAQGSEIVFANAANGAATDLEGLRIDHDTNRDGILSALDADFSKFGIWQDLNGNGVTDPGEFRSLIEAGIVSISLVSNGKSYTAANGDVVVFGETTFSKSDGTTGIVGDVAFTTGRQLTDSQKTVANGTATAGIASALVAAGLITTAAAAMPGPADTHSASSTLAQTSAPGAGKEVDGDGGHRSVPSGETKEAVVENFVDTAGSQPRPSSSQSGVGEDVHDQPGGSSIKAASALLPDSEGAEAAQVSSISFLDMSAMAFLPQAVQAPVEASVIQSAELKAVLEDALGGPTTSEPDIGSLLDHLSGGGAANQLFSIEVDSGGDQGAVAVSYQSAFHHFDLAMISHEAATASA